MRRQGLVTAEKQISEVMESQLEPAAQEPVGEEFMEELAERVVDQIFKPVTRAANDLAPEPNPTAGRIVRFVEPNGEERAAIVVRVNQDQSVNLHVFLDNAVQHQHSVFCGDDAGCWHWPER